MSQKATEEEAEALRSKGINLKNPTKLTLVATALYEKAAKGDISALKEIFSHTEDTNKAAGGVVFIDDIPNTNK